MGAKKVQKTEFDAFAAAREAGLDKAVSQFPEDVAAAAQAALQDRNDLPALSGISAEPWPPMRMRRVQ